MTEPHDVASLLAAYRSVAGPDGAASARTWERLEQRARAGDVVAIAPEPEPDAGPAPSSLRILIAATAAAAAVAAIAYAIGADSASRTRASAFEQAVHERGDGARPDTVVSKSPPVAEPPAALPPRAEPVPSISPQAAVPREPTSVVTRPRVRPTPAAAVAPEPEPEASVDATEIAALRQAQRLLARDPAEALRLLERHADDYPGSSLGSERQVARITALCNVGRGADARAAAARFATDHPRSPLLARVRAVCPDVSNSQTDPSPTSME